MLEKKLHAYFTLPTLRVALVLAVGAAWLLMTILALPGTDGYQELHNRFVTVFVRELGVAERLFEGLFVVGYFLFMILAPIGFLFVGLAGWQSRRQVRNFTDAEADAALHQRLQQLPAILETRLGLAGMGEDDALLVLWGPRPKDRTIMQLAPSKRRKQLSKLPGRMAVGQDGVFRFARLHVLVLEKRGQTLYVMNGFYNLLNQQMAGETWGEYRLAQARRVKANPDECRVALLMDDGMQFVVNLLTARENKQVSQQMAYPVVLFEEASEVLRTFCQIQEPAERGPVPAPEAQAEGHPVPEPEPLDEAPRRDQGAPEAGLEALEEELRRICHGDEACMERLIAVERTRGHGQTRAEWIEAAIRQFHRDNQ